MQTWTCFSLTGATCGETKPADADGACKQAPVSQRWHDTDLQMIDFLI